MPQPTRSRLGLALWLAAMAGVLALALTVLPQLLAAKPLPAPRWVLIAASVVQLALMLALAAWAGATLSRPVGLGSPAVEALLSRRPLWPALRPQLLPAVVAGIVVAGALRLIGRVTPPGLVAAGRDVELPLVAKLLYGGITEEVLMRWGVMTFVVWLGWRLLQKGEGGPRSTVVVGAILTAALLFGVLHLPAVVAMGVTLTPSIVLYILAGNGVAAMLLGLLYWRKGLEAAVMAHALAHAIAALVATA